VFPNDLRLLMFMDRKVKLFLYLIKHHDAKSLALFVQILYILSDFRF
jgi:hypothetical protein